MAVDLGLKFDLSQLRASVRSAADLMKRGMVSSLKPFDRALVATRAKVSAIGRAAFSLKGAFAGILSAVVIARMAKWAGDAIKAAAALTDARTALKNVIQATGGKVSFAGAVAQQETISLATGASRTDVAAAQTDLIGRGFGPAQVKELTALAASAATRTGKSVQDAAKLLGNAMSGNVKAAQQLGIQIAASGDKVKDAQAVAEKVREVYGGLADQLTNPIDRLKATWQSFMETLGGALAPVFDDVVTWLGDVARGLGAEGVAGIVQQVTGAIGSFVGVLDWAWQTLKAVGASYGSFVNLIASAFTDAIPGAFNSMLSAILAMLDSVIRKIPGVGEKIADGMGLGEMARARGESGKSSLAAFKGSVEAHGGNLANFVSAVKGENSTGKRFEEARAQGAAMREAASAEMAATTGTAGSLVNPLAAQAAGDKARAAAQKQLAGRTAKLAADAREGQQVRVQIVSARPDRFRRMRPA